MTNKKFLAGLNFLYCDKRIRLIHGVLKGLHISIHSDNYDDLFQEGCLTFAQVYADYPGTLTSPADERQLMAYAYRRVRWRLLDLLRHQQLAVNHQQCSLNQDEVDPDKNALLVDRQAPQPLACAVRAAFFADLWRQSNGPARRYLRLALQDRFPNDTAIARHCGVSRQAVFQWKKQLLSTARRCRQDWSDMV